MHTQEQRPDWSGFLRYYTGANMGRPTRIGLFEKTSDVTNDYWLEDGLPLRGLDLDFKNGMPVIEIMLEGYTHVVRGVRSIRPIYSIDGTEDGIDLIGPGETTTILRFEN
ncbi:MAG TPA: hypothetical protein PKD26_04300 [Pyrinomonadaceae bacterium]|nr:hypothetical protein [Pyrinomonadaceae bacterium]